MVGDDKSLYPPPRAPPRAFCAARSARCFSCSSAAWSSTASAMRKYLIWCQLVRPPLFARGSAKRNSRGCMQVVILAAPQCALVARQAPRKLRSQYPPTRYAPIHALARYARATSRVYVCCASAALARAIVPTTFPLMNISFIFQNRSPSALVSYTSRRVTFIKLSQSTRCPLNVTPFLSSTSWREHPLPQMKGGTKEEDGDPP